MSISVKGLLQSSLKKLDTSSHQKIFFLHIPKCGGTSIDQAMRDSYGLVTKLHGRYFFGLDPSASLSAANIMDEDMRSFREKLLIYNMSKQSMRFISGHFYYSQRAFDEFGQDWDFVTVLREPVAKWISQYFYNTYKASSHFKFSKNLEEYLASEDGTATGCDYVSHFIDTVETESYVSDEAINHAISNIEQFKLVGILEKLNVFSSAYEARYGTKLMVGKTNASPVKSDDKRKQITPELLEEIRKICYPNIQVYNHFLNRE